MDTLEGIVDMIVRFVDERDSRALLRVMGSVSKLLRDSVRLAQLMPDAARPFVRQHSQEMADDVCDRHIALYVNERTVDLGDQGRAAIDEMLRRGRSLGLLANGRSPWRGDA
jgi:predicted solute-binding protein